MNFGLQKSSALTGIEIAVSNRQRARKLDLPWLEKIAAATLAKTKVKQAELGIVLVGEKEMAKLNETFLGHEGSTDVITFDYSEPGRPAVTAAAAIQGEIFICVADAERQAKLFGTNWRSEVVRYVVHGILHLMGHDDLQPVARRKMKRVEGRLVRELSRLFALSK
jgi:probable rRNA maturation factor